MSIHGTKCQLNVPIPLGDWTGIYVHAICEWAFIRVICCSVGRRLLGLTPLSHTGQATTETAHALMRFEAVVALPEAVVGVKRV